MVGTTDIDFEVTSSQRYGLYCVEFCHFIEQESLNNQCAKFQCNAMLIVVFKMMLKI